MAWLYQALPLASSVSAADDQDYALTGEASASEAGTCVPNRTVALSGSESLSGHGLMDLGDTSETISGTEVAVQQGSTGVNTLFVRLRSRKTAQGGSTAEHVLTTLSAASGQGTVLNNVSKLLGGSGITLSQQTFASTQKQRSVLLQGQERTMARGNISYVPSGSGSGSLPPWTQIPTQVNESNYYDTDFGPDSGKDEVWIWTPGDKTCNFTLPPTNLLRVGHTMHDDTEGDDLWHHYMQYKRVTDATARNIHDQWGTAWRNFFVDDYVPSVIAQGDDADFYPIGNCNSYDHLYGWGALMWAMEKNDLSARNAVLSLAAQVETQMYASLVPGVNSASLSGARRYSRRLMFYTYVALMEPTARWIAARDFMIDFWLQSPGYLDSTNSPILPGKGAHHFMGRSSFGTTSEGAAGGLGVFNYDEGYRVSNAIYYATSGMAIWAAYKATGRSELRDMMIQMARFILNYAWDPDHVNAMTGSYWGVEPDGTPWHQHQDNFTHNAGLPSVTGDPLSVPNTASGPPNTPWTDPNSSSADNYEICHINTLVHGYKLTGEFAFLKRAREHFRQATQYSALISKGIPKQPSNIVLYFCDTRRDANLDYFTQNKGMLQNCSALFENDGNPEIEGGTAWTPEYPVPISPGEVIPIGGITLTDPAEIIRAIGTTAAQTQWPTNTFAMVSPTEGLGTQMLTGGDTGCTVLPNYSLGGAIGAAGGGGHSGATNFGGAVFDFTDAAWKWHWTGGSSNVNAANGWSDVRTGSRVHNCLNLGAVSERYNTNCGYTTNSCQNPAHWTPSAAQLAKVPRTADPSDQTWEISQVFNTTLPLVHQYPVEAEWGGLGVHSITGYVNPSLRFDPTPPGTLAPTQSGLPAPAHIWKYMFELAPDEGGGPKGSIVCCRHANMGDTGNTNMWYSHRYDLDAGVWHTYSTNTSRGGTTEPPGGGPWTQDRSTCGAYDPVGKRFFLIATNHFSQSSGARVNYINKSDATWRNVNFGTVTSGSIPPGVASTQNLMVDPDRRLLVIASGESGTTLDRLRVANLASVPGNTDPNAIITSGSGGWRDVLGSTIWPFGSVSHSGIPFVYYPPNGKYYRFIARPAFGRPGAPPASMTEAQYWADPIACTHDKLERVTPPPIDAAAHAADPNYYINSANWTVDEITLSMRMPRGSLGAMYSAVGLKWFEYMPALELLAWCPLNNVGTDPNARRPVYLIKPF